MDFFEHQDDARRKTGRMIVLFMLAVISIVAALNIVFAGFYIYGIGDMSQNISSVPLSTQINSVPPEVFVWVSGVTLLVIGGGSLYRISQLSGGGQAVAEMVGARKVSRDTLDAKEKQLINVVDEMAIASGVTVPQVYIMDEEMGINAFAAGYKPNEAIVAVTRGTLEQLDRDELQGVIAHEFSHILNGDMRINIRLMGVLFGILIIGMLGGYMLRSMTYSRHRSSSNGKGAGAVLVIGLALMIIGYAGVFFGRLIKAGVSRQREFLADASAVQFTRNNQGITDALKKIGKLDEGSLIENPHAEELSHMFFGESFRTSFAGWMATHPPLIDRIKRLNKGRLPLSSPSKRKKIQEAAVAEMAQPLTEQVSAMHVGGVANIASTIGNPGEMHMQYAAALLASIPEPVSESLALEKGAAALMVALVLDKDPDVRAMELDVVRQSAHQQLEPEILRLASHLDSLHARYRLPLFDMAIPELKGLPVDERASLIDTVKAVIDADRKIKLDELTIYVLVKEHLSATSSQADRVKYKTLHDLKDEISLLLSLLSYLGKADGHSIEEIFRAATAEIEALLPNLQLQNPKTFKPDNIISALDKFNGLSPSLKGVLVTACIQAVLFDEDVTTRELEVMRSVCTVMEVPMPPVLMDQA
ncbi:MAG: M48 family metallopeptidase [Gammaproteobacteria bacterium]|nr:M48 family metallopeptidase [Gammaproteobacteria bacterium]